MGCACLWWRCTSMCASVWGVGCSYVYRCFANIQQAYLGQARLLHPDKNPSGGAKWQALCTAYQALRFKHEGVRCGVCVCVCVCVCCEFFVPCSAFVPFRPSGLGALVTLCLIFFVKLIVTLRLPPRATLLRLPALPTRSTERRSHPCLLYTSPSPRD